MERYQLTDRDKNLIETSLEVIKQNYDDGVYNHTVGCALLCRNGKIYKGVNCDGIVYAVVDQRQDYLSIIRGL